MARTIAVSVSDGDRSTGPLLGRMTQVRGTFQMNYTLEIDTIEDADFLVLTALAMSGGLASITIDGKTFTRGHVSEITYTAHPRSVRIVMTGPPLV